MKILTGKQVDNKREAVRLAFQAAGVDDISADILDMFTSLANIDTVSGEADKIIGAAVKNRYGSKVTWRADRWFVPIPKLSYSSKDMPQLVIEVIVYVIAVVTIKTQQDSRHMTLAGSVGKPQILTIPMVFLHALVEKDQGRFSIVARDVGNTTWEVPGAKPVRLPNDFVSELNEMLKYQSVVSWLREFGTQGKSVAPLVTGSLLGLAFQDSTQPVPVSREVVTTDNLVSALESMAYRPTEAKEMVKRVAPRLRADMTLEEAIRITLQMGKGGD
ncbi:MAG: RuvA C-terminal domain-containing protein [Dehalococcoidales bacterium]|nr:RuvA C-terminal domain-containing protein [Dehalococcoidales bacterium]